MSFCEFWSEHDWAGKAIIVMFSLSMLGDFAMIVMVVAGLVMQGRGA